MLLPLLKHRVPVLYLFYYLLANKKFVTSYASTLPMPDQFVLRLAWSKYPYILTQKVVCSVFWNELIYKYSIADQLHLKGLSHEIDFKNFEKNLQHLAKLRDVAGFEFFRGSDDFILQKVYLLRLMPVCGLIMASCLFLSDPPITSGV